MTCAVEDCGRPAWRGELCRGHWQRKHLGKQVAGELRPRGRTPKEVFWDSVLDLVDLRPSDDRGWELTRKRIETAAARVWGRGSTK